MTSDRVEDLLQIEGLVTVELFNERNGRLYQREQGHNFISVYGKEVLKQMQRNVMGQYFAGVRSTDAWGRQLWDQPSFPFSHLMAWNDTAPEDAANERTIKGVPTVAFASRFPQGSPSGKRGVINITESLANNTSQKYVFDWLTSNGNGTFQSVGWTNCDTNGRPLSIFPDPYFSVPPLAVNIATANTYYRGGLWHDGTGWLTLHTTGRSSYSSQYAIYRIDETTGVGTLLCTLPSTAFLYQDQNNYAPPNAWDLCMIGTDYYVVGSASYQGSNAPTHVAKFNSAGVQQWLVVHDGGANEMPGSTTGAGWSITTDGTDLYIGFGKYSAPGTGKIYKLSATTGLVTATITPVDNQQPVHGLAWDGTNFRVLFADGVISTINLAGATVATDPIGVYTGRDSGTATAPFSGSWYAPSGALNQEILPMYYYTYTGSGTAMDDMARSHNQGVAGDVNYYPGYLSNWPNGALHFRNGKVYLLMHDGYPQVTHTTPTRIYEMTHTSLGSRVLLASPVTKDASKTMKITYTLNFS